MNQRLMRVTGEVKTTVLVVIEMLESRIAELLQQLTDARREGADREDVDESDVISRE